MRNPPRQPRHLRYRNSADVPSASAAMGLSGPAERMRAARGRGAPLAGRRPARAALGEPPLDLPDLRAALWRLRVGQGHGEQPPTLRRAGEPCDAIHDWHAPVLPRAAIRTPAP